MKELKEHECWTSGHYSLRGTRAFRRKEAEMDKRIAEIVEADKRKHQPTKESVND